MLIKITAIQKVIDWYDSCPRQKKIYFNIALFVLALGSQNKYYEDRIYSIGLVADRRMDSVASVGNKRLDDCNRESKKDLLVVLEKYESARKAQADIDLEQKKLDLEFEKQQKKMDIESRKLNQK